MPQSQGSPEPGKKGWSTTTIGVVVAGIVALAGLFIAQSSGRSLSMKFGDHTIELGANPEIGAVLDQAIATNAQDFEALLAARNYYRVTSPSLVDAMARIDAAKEEYLTVTAGMRQLLVNLDGPFAGPGTLRSADEGFMAALEDLDRPLGDTPEEGRLIIELWRRSLERRSPFGLRLFQATVMPVRADANGAPLVYVCPRIGANIAGKAVEIFRPTGSPSIQGVLEPDTRRRLDCTGAAASLREMFMGKPIVLGIDPTRFGLLAEGSGDILPAQIQADFEIQPIRAGMIAAKP